MKALRTLNLLIICLATICFFSACKKSSSGGGTTPPPVTPEVEVPLAFTISPDPAASIQPVTGASHTVAVTVTSKLPTKGVDAVIDVRRDNDNGVIFNQQLTLSSSSFSTTITGLVQGVVCTATITLNSKGTTTNTATKSFKLARK